MPAITLEPTTPTVPAKEPRKGGGGGNPGRCHIVNLKTNRRYCRAAAAPGARNHKSDHEKSPCPGCGNPKCIRCLMAWRSAKGNR